MKFENIDDLKKFLDNKIKELDAENFIFNDPIIVPHSFHNKDDIETSAFLTSILAWGNRKTIINKAFYLMKLMYNEPYYFIKNASNEEFLKFKNFVHRTLNGNVIIDFISGLRNIIIEYNNLENLFTELYLKNEDIKFVLIDFKRIFSKNFSNFKSLKHISTPENNSSSKRLNLFLRWMIRKDNKNIDFGLWEKIPPSTLYIPLDIHTGNTARKLGLITRKQNDWKTVEELTNFLKKLDKEDPIKYDFALFMIDL